MTEYKIEYDKLISNNLNNDLHDIRYQTHHIIPRCLGGSNDKSNLVGLLPSDHVKAHELLYKYYYMKACELAHAYESMIGKKAFNKEEYDSKTIESYKLTRKKTVYNKHDLSPIKIKYDDKIPDGYVALTKLTRSKNIKSRWIFNTNTMQKARIADCDPLPSDEW